jgi:hypothetical protein
MIENAQSNEPALKQQFLVRAKAMSELPEVFRCQRVTQLLCDMLALGVRDEAEIFQAVYGDPGGREYWSAHLSEPIRVYKLAHILSIHVAESAQQLELARIAIMRAFRDAAAAGEDWFVGNTSPLLAVEDGQTNFAELAKLKVHPWAAVEWLLSKPKREYLVPGSLRIFLESGGESVNTKGSARPPGKRTFERFVTKYIEDETAAGRRPTLKSLEAAAKEAHMRGGRDYLRTAFHRLRGADVRRGRPPKASTKIAEK